MNQRYFIGSSLHKLRGLGSPLFTKELLQSNHNVLQNYIRLTERFVSSSILPQVHYGRISFHYNKNHRTHLLQKRSYIFLPSSFAELIRILRNSVAPICNSEPSKSSKLFIRLKRSKDQVFSKVQQTVRIITKARRSISQHSRTFKKDENKPPLSITATPPSSSSLPSKESTTLYHRFSLWKGTKKQRVRDKLLAIKKAQQIFMGKVKIKQQRLSSYDWRQSYDSLLKKSLSLDPTTLTITTDSTIHVQNMDHTSSMEQPSYSYYKRKLRSLHLLLSHPKLVLYSQQLFTLTEPFEPSWFDTDGYPLTSQDPYSLRYVNPWMSLSSNGWKPLRDVWKWKKDRVMDLRTKPTDLTNHPMYATVPQPIPWNQVNIKPPMDHEPKIKLTWIGHATCLVYISNQFTILTDPIFSKKASPFQKWTEREFFGVPRYFPPAVSLFDDASIEQDDPANPHVPPTLPPVIDVCLISHDHYDHLDYSSIVKLVHRVKFWVVPLGIKQWLVKNISGIDASTIVELKWWDHVTLTRRGASSSQRSGDIVLETTVDGDTHNKKSDMAHSIKITCAPAQHWCSRTPWDRNTRLWCSWAVHSWISSQGVSMEEEEEEEKKSSKRLAFFFAGDTARPDTFPLHRQIGDRLGPFDLSAIPIGAYEPRFFMRDSHCDPDEAVQIHQDLMSRKSVAIHWGTFPLANESYWDPSIRLQNAVERFSGDDSKQKIDFTAIGIGESIESTMIDESIEPLQVMESH